MVRSMTCFSWFATANGDSGGGAWRFLMSARVSSGDNVFTWGGAVF